MFHCPGLEGTLSLTLHCIKVRVRSSANRNEDEASSHHRGQSRHLQKHQHHRPLGLPHLRPPDELLQQRAGDPVGKHAEGGGGADQPGLGALGEGEDLPR